MTATGAPALLKALVAQVLGRRMNDPSRPRSEAPGQRQRDASDCRDRDTDRRDAGGDA
jgi:hypothetical protein